MTVSKNTKEQNDSDIAGNFDGVEANKIRFAVYLFPETMKTINSLYKGDNCSTKSEFIEKAIRFYCGYLLQNKPELIEYLAPQIGTITDGIIKGSEQRLSRAIFKLAVEVGVQTHVLAAINDIDESTLFKLRSMVRDEVRRINGVINFENALRYQRNEE